MFFNDTHQVNRSKNSSSAGFLMHTIRFQGVIFAVMASKRKKKKANPAKKPAKSDIKAFQADKEESIDWKALARDERTWKIVGVLSLLFALFLFISFVSYLFTWKEDQAIAQQGF